MSLPDRGYHRLPGWDGVLKLSPEFFEADLSGVLLPNR